MKKALVVFALVLVIAVSIVAGTLAMYTTTISDLASGSVVAKEFVFLEDGLDSFSQDVKIAPSETTDPWTFRVKNFTGANTTDHGTVSQTPMKMTITLDVGNIVGATTGTVLRSAIGPLVVTVKEGTTEKVKFIGTVSGEDANNGIGSVSFTDDNAFTADQALVHTYTVTATWPDGTPVVDNANMNHGSSIKVSAVATQITPTPAG